MLAYFCYVICALGLVFGIGTALSVVHHYFERKVNEEDNRCWFRYNELRDKVADGSATEEERRELYWITKNGRV